MYMLRAISVYLGYILSILVMCASQPQDKLNRPQNQLSQDVAISYTVMSKTTSAVALIGTDITTVIV